ncbi:MAG: CorA family divalent cation transporter [Candidatus Micrarchaeota archaeon]|nr:CorA family divalent cation transporter [Candidatus Micrarchaeota archaeon]
MIKTAVCQNGKVDIKKGIANCKNGKNSFVWVYAPDPSQAELAEIEKKFNIQKEVFQRYSHETKSKKYSSNPLAFVMVDYYVEKEQIQNSRLLFILKENALITIVPKKSEYYDYLFERVLEALRLRKEKATITWLLYDFLEEDIEDNYEVLQKTEEMISKFEETVIDANTQGSAKEIVRFKRELFKMRRRFWASAKIVFLMRKGLTPVKIDQDAAILLDDVYDTLIHQLDIMSTQHEMLTDVLTIYSTKISNEISKRVKKLTYITLVLTGIGAVLTVPNTIATIFGIPYFPRELGEGIAWEYILALLGISTIISTYFLYRYWQKQGLTEESKE